MTNPQIKTEYQGLREIGERMRKCEATVYSLIMQAKKPLPARKVGREWWLTEAKLQEWLNN